MKNKHTLQGCEFDEPKAVDVDLVLKLTKAIKESVYGGATIGMYQYDRGCMDGVYIAVLYLYGQGYLTKTSEPWQPSYVPEPKGLHSNPDAQAWAAYFVEVFPEHKHMESVMHCWFANAMMAMHDSLLAKPVENVTKPELSNTDEALEVLGKIPYSAISDKNRETIRAALTAKEYETRFAKNDLDLSQAHCREQAREIDELKRELAQMKLEESRRLKSNTLNRHADAIEQAGGGEDV